MFNPEKSIPVVLLLLAAVSAAADLTFEAVARDEYRYEFETPVSFIEATRAACEALAAEQPGLMIDCDPWRRQP